MCASLSMCERNHLRSVSIEAETADQRLVGAAKRAGVEVLGQQAPPRSSHMGSEFVALLFFGVGDGKLGRSCRSLASEVELAAGKADGSLRQGGEVTQRSGFVEELRDMCVCCLFHDSDSIHHHAAGR